MQSVTFAEFERRSRCHKFTSMELIPEQQALVSPILGQMSFFQ
jgi:hypothetical protein